MLAVHGIALIINSSKSCRVYNVYSSVNTIQSGEGEDEIHFVMSSVSSVNED